MKKSLEDSARLLNRLGYRPLWDKILKHREKKRLAAIEAQRHVALTVEELEIRQMLSASIDVGVEGEWTLGNFDYQDIYRGTGRYDLHVDRGDGSESVIFSDLSVSEAGGNTQINSDSLELLYADDGTYSATFSLFYDQSLVYSESTVAVVENVPPVLGLSLTPVAAGTFGSVQLDLIVSDPGADSVVQWTVDWGDGNQDTLGVGVTSANHAYDTNGNYVVDVVALDDDGISFSSKLIIDGQFGSNGKVVVTTEGDQQSQSSVVLSDGSLVYSGTMNPLEQEVGNVEEITFGGNSTTSEIGKVTVEADQLLQIDTDSVYRMTARLWSGDGLGNNVDPTVVHYVGFKNYDIDHKFISAYMVQKVSEAIDTYLAVDLKPGDTQIVLQDGTGWNDGSVSHRRSLAWYGYTDSTGHTYDDFTYTRNYRSDLWDPDSIDGNVINLREAWAGETLLAGTAVRNAQAGGHTYTLARADAFGKVPTEVSSLFGAGRDDIYEDAFRDGTAFIRPVVLHNYSGNSSANQFNVSDFSIVEVTESAESILMLRSVDGSGVEAVDFASNVDQWAIGLGSIQSQADIHVASDGSLLVGFSRMVDGEVEWGLAKVNTDGTLDDDFGTNGFADIQLNGISLDSKVVQVVETETGYILAGQVAQAQNADIFLAAFGSSGNVDVSFGSSGISTFSNQSIAEVFGGSQQTDGKIVLGVSVTIGGNDQLGAIRFGQDGNVDSSFGQAGIAQFVQTGVDNRLQGLIVDSSDRIVLAGIESTGSEFNLVRILANGSVDGSFGTSGIVETGLILQSAGIYRGIGDEFWVSGTQVNSLGTVSQFRQVVSKFQSSGALDTSFAGTGSAVVPVNSANSQTGPLALGSNGSVFALTNHQTLGAGADVAVSSLLQQSTIQVDFNSVDLAPGAMFTKVSQFNGNLAYITLHGEYDPLGLTATVDWGDLSSPQNATISSVGNNVFSLSLTKDFDNFGSRDIQIDVFYNNQLIGQLQETIEVLSIDPVPVITGYSDFMSYGYIDLEFAGIEVVTYNYVELRTITDVNGDSVEAEVYSDGTNDLFFVPNAGSGFIQGEVEVSGQTEVFYDDQPNFNFFDWPNDADGVYDTIDGAYRAVFVTINNPPPNNPGRKIELRKPKLSTGNIRDLQGQIDWGDGSAQGSLNFLVTGGYDSFGTNEIHTRRIYFGSQHDYQNAGDHTATFTVAAPVDILDNAPLPSPVDGNTHNYGTTSTGKVEFRNTGSASLVSENFNSLIKDYAFNGVVGLISGLAPGYDLNLIEGTIFWGDGTYSDASFAYGFGDEISVLGSHQYKQFGDLDVRIELFADGAAINTFEAETIWSHTPISYQPTLPEEVMLGELLVEATGVSVSRYDYLTIQPNYVTSEGTTVSAVVYETSNGDQLFVYTNLAGNQAVEGTVDGVLVTMLDHHPGINGQGDPTYDNDGIFESNNAAYRTIFKEELGGGGTTGGPGVPGTPGAGTGTTEYIELRKLKFADGKTFQDLSLSVDWGVPETGTERFLVVDVFNTYGEDDYHLRNILVLGENPYASGHHVATFTVDAPAEVGLYDDDGAVKYGNQAIGKVRFREGETLVEFDYEVESQGAAATIAGREGETVNVNLRLSEPADEYVFVTLEIFNPSATPDDYQFLDHPDFIPATLMARFAPGETQKTLQLQLNTDYLKEANEDLTFRIQSTVRAGIGDIDSLIVGILDPEVQIDLSGDVIVDEGNTEDPTTVAYTVRRYGSTLGTTEVSWSIEANGVQLEDFVGGIVPSGTVVFAPGETAAQILIELESDTVVEVDENGIPVSESFILHLDGVTDDLTDHTVLIRTSATGTINDDDIDLSINAISEDGSVEVRSETSSGIAEFHFKVERSGDLNGTTTVGYQVISSEADANDFVGGAFPAGTVTFAPGEIYQEIVIQVQGDTEFEENESFTVVLLWPASDSQPDRVVDIEQATATGLILNDETQLALNPITTSANEGNSGLTEFQFEVTRSGNVDDRLEIAWSLSGGDAVASDFEGFVLPSGVVTFSAGQTTALISVNVIGDVRLESDESFTIRLDSVESSSLDPTIVVSQAEASAVILNDDSAGASNSPPRFTSTPDGDAIAGISYEYNSTASDVDGDSLVFSMGEVIWPEGFIPEQGEAIQFQYVNNGIDQRGIYTWTPPARLAGQTVTVEEVVFDGANEPVRRQFEIYVSPLPGNQPPVITSQPTENYELPLDIPGYNNSDPVSPDYVSVQLANGEEVTVRVSVDPQGIGSPTADIVFAIDATLSMQNSIDWLNQTAIGEIETQLAALGITNNRYGLVVFNDSAQTGAATQHLAIAVGNVSQYTPPNNEDPNVFDIPQAQTSAELWGTSAELITAVSYITASSDNEAGYDALNRILDSSIADVSGIPQFTYDFRYDATISVVFVSDDNTTGYNYVQQQDLTSQLLGNPDIPTDDIVFSSILRGAFTGDNEQGNDSWFVHNGDGWRTTNDSLLFEQTETNPVGFSMVDLRQFPWIAFDTPLGPMNPHTSWSVSTEFTVSSSQAASGANARIYFGREVTGGNLPGSSWFLEANFEDDSWIIYDHSGNAHNFTLHNGVTLPDLLLGQSYQVELRLIGPERAEGVQELRFDLFVDGQAIGAQLIPEYTNTLLEVETLNYVGLGANRSDITFDKIEVRSFYNSFETDDLFDFPATAPTPTDFSDPNRDEIATVVFYNDFGNIDGSEYSDDIIGYDIGGVAYQFADNPLGFSRLGNPHHTILAGYQEQHYLAMANAVNGSVWNVDYLAAEASTTQLESFANAFAESLSLDILSRQITVESPSEVVTAVTPIIDYENPTVASFDVTIRGTGGAEVTELNFVRTLSDGTSSEIASIPLFLTAVIHTILKFTTSKKIRLTSSISIRTS